MINSDELESQERGLSLTTREDEASEATAPEEEKPRRKYTSRVATLESELDGVKQELERRTEQLDGLRNETDRRLRAARKLKFDRNHCRDCFERGRNAAVKVLAGDE